ncbi:MAG TPA: prolyl oligopeptidase family serine peptidase [Candidatus Dormibacteraeota bacterium]
MTRPPETPVDEVVEVIHGVEVREPYRWLEDARDPRVRAWEAEQDAYARRFLEGLPERPAVGRRLREALDCGALGTVAPRGRWRFFTRRTAGMEQVALYVLDKDDVERLLVDPAPLSGDAATAIDWYQPSQDGELAAFGISEGGDENSVLHLVETASSRVLDDRIPRCRAASVAFEPGNQAFLYTRYPLPGEVPEGEETYHRRVFRHLVGQSAETDVLIHREAVKTHWPGPISISTSGRWAVMNVHTAYGENRVLLRAGEGAFRGVFEAGGKECYAWFAGERLLAITNFEAPNYRLVEIDPARPASADWSDLVPESEHVLFGVAATAGSLLVHHLVDCSSRLARHRPDGEHIHDLAVPELCTVTGIGASAGVEDAYFSVERFTEPAAVWAVDREGEVAPLLKLEPPPGFDPARYPVRQVWYRSRDGERVPMFLVGRASGHGIAAMTGYGGFNNAMTPLWKPDLVPLLEAGGLFALPNLRGGSEFGERWHRAGNLARKQNVFDDFIAAAEWLIEQGLTSPERLAVYGRSNGGLLVGAALTQRPELFGAVWSGVPLLDMVRYEGFQIAQLWATEYGSAADAEQFGWLYAYSPYHHVRDGVRYPPVLLTCGEEDTRVDPMHARKMAARLQAANPAGLTLLRVERRGGHGQGKPVAKLAEEDSDAWSFILHHLGDSASE